jgi:hypothetical protein
MSGNTGKIGGFRQRLDAVLRRRNPAELRAFLIEEGQWTPEAATDEEAAMWMMIAASPVLADLHPEAERWLMDHGHELEARAILGGQHTASGRSEPKAAARTPDGRSRPGHATGHTRRRQTKTRPRG